MKRHNVLLRFLCLAILFTAGLGIAGSGQAAYHLIKKIPYGGASGGRESFDYLTFDSAARRVYLSHGTEVKVVEADTGKVVGNITGLKRCHGIALVHESGKGFITDGDAGAVVIFDLKTLKVTGQVKTADDTDAIIYDPASGHIFSFNGDSHSATAIDPQTGTVVGSVDVGGGPEFAVADGKGTIFNNNEKTNEVVVIDSRKLAVKARWPVKPAGAPTALALDREHRRLFIGGREPQMLVVMNADNGKVIQSFPISAGVDAAVFEPETGMIFASTRDGMVHIFHEDTPDKYSVVETVTTEYGAKTMALDPKTHNIYLTTADFGEPGPPTAKRPHPGRAMVPGTFHLLIYGR
jgi:DNA-binding beta-propeller fold protein YncE